MPVTVKDVELSLREKEIETIAKELTDKIFDQLELPLEMPFIEEPAK